MADVSNTCTIYALSDPRKPELIRYIGKTQKPLHRRLAEHVAERNRNLLRCHRRSWIIKLFSQGLKPIIWPLEICERSNWIEREKHWIWFFRPLGNLTNGTDGGDGGLGNKGWKWSPEALAKVSIQRRGRKLSPQHVEQIRRRSTGRIVGEETRRKLSIANRGKTISLETRDKIRQKLLGKKHVLSPERLEMCRQRAKKYLKWPKDKPRPKRTPEAIEKCRAKMKGVLRPHIVMAGGKPVECIETGERYVSLWRASQAKDVPCGKIRRSIKHGFATKGLHWKLI